MAGGWFEAEQDGYVYARDGSTPIGKVRSGRRYRYLDTDDAWLVVPGPEGEEGVVASELARIEADPTSAQSGPPGAVVATPEPTADPVIATPTDTAITAPDVVAGPPSAGSPLAFVALALAVVGIGVLWFSPIVESRFGIRFQGRANQELSLGDSSLETGGLWFEDYPTANWAVAVFAGGAILLLVATGLAAQAAWRRLAPSPGRAVASAVLGTLAVAACFNLLDGADTDVDDRLLAAPRFALAVWGIAVALAVIAAWRKPLGLAVGAAVGGLGLIGAALVGDGWLEPGDIPPAASLFEACGDEVLDAAASSWCATHRRSPTT